MPSTYLEKAGELPPRGYCLFVGSGDTAPQRRRRQSTTSSSVVAPPLTPLLICQGDQVWICKAANALQQSGGILTWNHEVQISPTEPAMDTGGVVEELLQDLTILPVFTFVSREDECSASLISIDELEGDDVGPNFVATFEDPPDIPLSIAFRRTSASTRQPVSPLQLSCWKRQLVGLYVLYGEGLLTTTVSIADVSDGTTLELCIDSVCLRPSSSGLSSAADILLITPSTRITILEAEIEPPSLITEETTKISDVTDLLLGTIRTMANKTNNYNIPRIFLLSGPPGAGKTYAVKMALQLAQPTRVYTKFLQGSDIMASSSTESVTPGAVMERHFAQLKQQTLEDSTVCLVFLDECDSLMASPTAVAMLGLQLDELASADCYTRIIVVAATNNIEAVPQHLKRPGRFEQLLILAPPSLAQRLEILQKLVGESTPGLEEIAETTIGFVPVDLQALVRRARLLGLSNSRHSLDVNLRKAMVHVGASALRDSALTAPPKATWDSIAGDAGGAKTALIQAIEWPRTKKKHFELLGLAPPRGVLLHGPPGCAKTTLARAAAGSESVSFLSLSPADVFSSSYVGEAEAKIRKAFDNARAAAPCVLFFDEIDAIVGSNAGGGGHNMNRSGGGASAESRVLSTFLNETDGLTTSKGDRVLVIGATNRPSTLDAALLRPGRFDKVIYVPPPDYDGRLAFIKSLLQQMGTLQDVHETDLRQLASHEVSGKMTGAEISGAVREAAARFLRESLTEGNTPKLKAEDLEKALRDVKPLLMDDQILEEYAAFERSRKFH